jgi:hypothetical protein
LRALASAGIFAEDESGRFHLTPLAEQLCSDAPVRCKKPNHWNKPEKKAAFGNRG